jgi:hypothetical protein
VGEPVADGDGRIYFASGGKSYVVQSGPQLKVLAVNDSATRTTRRPPCPNGRLFIMGLKNLYCIAEKK